MNVIHILWELGYDVLNVNNGIYTIATSSTRCQKEKKYNINTEAKIDQTYNVFVEEVGFNKFGNLFVSFQEIGHPEYVFALYEYEHVSSYNYMAAAQAFKDMNI